MPLSKQNKHTNQQFIDDFIEVMSLKIIETTEILILGDFNIVVNDPTYPDAQLLIAWLESNYLHNIVDFPTHRSRNMLLVEAWYSLEQYIGLKEDKLSSTTVDFIRSEGNLKTKHLYWFSKPKMC